MNPRRLTPSMSLLVAFDAAARHLSFTRAAVELSLTQSAISRQVQSLEALLEVPLFKREGRNIVLTDIGRMYQAELGTALQRIRNASLQAIAYRVGGGSFHLAVLPTFAAKWLMPRLNGFYAQHPGTLVHVHSRIGRFDLELAAIDAVISVGDGIWPGLIAHPLLDETVLPVISPALARAHPLRQPGDLMQHLLLQVAARPDVWHRWCAAQGVPLHSMRLGPQFELTSHLIQAVASGIGVGLLPSFLVEDELRSGVLELAFDLPLATGAGYYLFVPPEKLKLPPIAAFTRWLTQADQVATGKTQVEPGRGIGAA
ncbi:MAG TPA: LysR substrate-binding domain-containing protein [Ideonella sp.]|nr:LysR substrate-binding domain-containing protein [Ideonella sp.]